MVGKGAAVDDSHEIWHRVTREPNHNNTVSSNFHQLLSSKSLITRSMTQKIAREDEKERYAGIRILWRRQRKMMELLLNCDL